MLQQRRKAFFASFAATHCELGPQYKLRSAMREMQQQLLEGLNYPLFCLLILTPSIPLCAGMYALMCGTMCECVFPLKLLLTAFGQYLNFVWNFTALLTSSSFQNTGQIYRQIKPQSLNRAK